MAKIKLNNEVPTYDIYSSIADKVSAICSHKIFRRMKDLVDLYFYISNFDIRMSELKEVMSSRGRTIDDISYICGSRQVNIDKEPLHDLQNAWNSLQKQLRVSLDFTVVRNKCLDFIEPLEDVENNEYIMWRHENLSWMLEISDSSDKHLTPKTKPTSEFD